MEKVTVHSRSLEIAEAALEAEKHVSDGPHTLTLKRHCCPARVIAWLDVVEAADEYTKIMFAGQIHDVAATARAYEKMRDALARLHALDEADHG